MYQDFNESEEYNQDPLENSMLREMYEAEMEHSMRWSYKRIQSMGIDNWFKIFPYDTDKKIRIVENMMLWFADPSREEYEKSAFLREALDRIQSITMTKQST
jgi:hypothetical protein